MMTGPRRILPSFAALLTATVLLSGGAVTVRAQGELEQTPWATSMVYPVGNPLDFQQPAPGEDRGFRMSRGLQWGRRDRHEGLDLSNSQLGGEVRAVAPGLVVETSTGRSGGWGNMVVLAHRLPGGDLLFSLFAHLLPGSISVRQGEVVALGQPLGRIGSTGRSTGPHLHLEFRALQDPLKALREQPLAQAWMRATIVDPLRYFSTMLPQDSQGFLPGLLGGAGAPARPAVSPATDPLFALVQGGALPRTALDRPEEALTRGELYRLALAGISRPKEDLPQRWSTVRDRLLTRSRRLPDAARARFTAEALPRRENDARAPASLSETLDVLDTIGALPPARSGGAGAGRMPRTPAPDRRMLEDVCPHGLAALESPVPVVAATAAPLPEGFVGPPAVSRRQVAYLWAFVTGTSASAGADASASQP